jgi:hypothetical protein
MELREEIPRKRSRKEQDKYTRDLALSVYIIIST